jgi:hypothetical protein
MAHDPLTIEFEFRNQRFTDASKGLQAFYAAIKKDFDSSAPQLLSVQLKNFLDTVAQALARRHGVAWPGGTTPTTMSVRSGGSIQSIIDSVKVEGQTFASIRGYIGGAFPLSVHEFGATIVSKGKLLTIPLPAALDDHGIPLKKSAREWSNTFVARSKKGNLLIFQKVGTQIIPLYVLKSKVTIPPRLGMGDTIRTGLPYFVDKAMDSIVKSITGNAQ